MLEPQLAAVVGKVATFLHESDDDVVEDNSIICTTFDDDGGGISSFSGDQGGLHVRKCMYPVCFRLCHAHDQYEYHRGYRAHIKPDNVEGSC